MWMLPSVNVKNSQSLVKSWLLGTGLGFELVAGNKVGFGLVTGNRAGF